MNRTCAQCGESFVVDAGDLVFYEKISPVIQDVRYLIPPPTHCPACRQRRRFTFRNERSLYRRHCDLTGAPIISMYAPDSPITVYEQNAWWGDGWDATNFGREYDFTRPFFDQFKDLFYAVPRINLMNKDHQNSEFCNFSLRNKNSYLLFGAAENEDCFYSNRSWKMKDCADCSNCLSCELCYEVVDSDHCYGCRFVQNSADCTDCILGYNLKGCTNCFGCVNLANAKYCIFNTQYRPDEYAAAVTTLLGDFANAQTQFQELMKTLPRKYMNGIANESSTGDALYHSKNARSCFQVSHAEDCRSMSRATFMRDSYDVDNDDNSELVYEAIGSETNYMHIFSDICWYDTNLSYCSLCFYSSNLFGCIGLKRKQYCVLNKQYTKEAYEELVPKIIAQMNNTGEWGEFFPSRISPFAYNESVAQETYPLTEQQALSYGFRWKQPDPKEYLPQTCIIPDTITTVPDSITHELLACEICNKNYRITAQELSLYRRIQVSIPRTCPDCRHQIRNLLRNVPVLWKRSCMKCGNPFETPYAPARPEIVYCEKCYLEAVY